MSVDGPGQGEAEDDLAIRPDWEIPGRAIVDAVTRLPGIDEARIGIWGVSLGGYYAARVASGDERVRAAISLCPVYCLGDIWDRLPDLSRAAFTVRSKSESAERARQRAAKLTMAGRAGQVSAPILIVAGKRDRIFPWQDADRLAAEIGPTPSCCCCRTATTAARTSSTSTARTVLTGWPAGSPPERSLLARGRGRRAPDLELGCQVQDLAQLAWRRAILGADRDLLEISRPASAPTW